MPRGDERRIGIKFHASVRKSNKIARQIGELLATELGDEYDIRTDGFCPPGWSNSDVSISFRGERAESGRSSPP